MSVAGVAAGTTLDGGVWEPHFVPSTVKMASPEYHGLLAHYYIPKATAQIVLTSHKHTQQSTL